MSIPRPYRFIIKYVAPVYLGVVFVGFRLQNMAASIAQVAASPVARATMILIGVVLALMVVFVRAGEKRWRAATAVVPETLVPETGS